MSDDAARLRAESRHVTHLRFVGGTIYCSVRGGRLSLDAEHKINDAFTCPACGEDVPATGQPHELQRPSQPLDLSLAKIASDEAPLGQDDMQIARDALQGRWAT